MSRLPVFFETLQSQQLPVLQPCQKIMRQMFSQKISPLPFASSLEEFDSVLKSLTARNSVPAIFIINTSGAENILLTLDHLMGEAPALFLRRNLSQDKRVMNMFGSAATGTTSVLSGMKPRLASVWGFGAKNVEDVAALAATCIIRFLNDGDFRHIERQNKFTLIAPLPARQSR